jgi:acetyltransferase-like isoleucine patch superfamily enzyme
MKHIIEPGAIIGDHVDFKGKVKIGYCSYIGYGNEQSLRTVIGDSVDIGAYCIINKGAEIGENVKVDHYCRIGYKSKIGQNTRVLYGAQIFDNVNVGSNCIIGGHLIDRVVVEDEVTYSGDMAHLHADPTGDWDETEEPSPIIRRGSVIGVGVLIIGSISIGPRAYIAAGEVVRCNVPEEMVLMKGKLTPLSEFHGIIKVRG